MSRLKPIHPEDMTDSAQRAYYDKIMSRENFKSLPSGTPLSGPFHAYQRSPNFASKMSDVTSYLRHDGLLEKRLVELATIITGRFWSAEVVFASHAPAALANGINEAAIEAIRHNKTPTFERADEAAIYGFTHTILNKRDVDDETYAATLDVLGEAGMVELIALIGSYSLTSMTLNTFRIPVRPGMARPYPDKQD
ncbi:MAG: 4-carboxymuconolactone decarboxylase [Alphaproteobacteria bacterium]|jgi:4-carboxymuconolactone decarboxylase